MRETSGDQSDARPWTIAVVVGLTVAMAAIAFHGAHERVPPATPLRPAPPYPWFVMGLPLAFNAAIATGVWCRRQWARIGALLLGGIHVALIVGAMTYTREVTMQPAAWTAAYATIVILLLLPETRRWFRERTRPGQRIDTPSVLVVPSEWPGKVWWLAIGMIFFFVALAAIVEGNALWFCLGMATLFGLMSIRMLAADCREVWLEIDRGRVVVRYGNTLFARLNVAFPLRRFGSVRTSLARSNKGAVHYSLELVTQDGRGTVVLTFGYANGWKRGMSDAQLEPEKITDLRQTIAHRLGIRDEGCVGFERFLPTLRRQEGERP